jgi:competence protein ComEA
MHPAEESLLRQVSQASNSPATTCPASGTSKTRLKPHRLRILIDAARASTWLPIASRGTAILGCMLGFAFIGIGATSVQPPGAPLASQAGPNRAAMRLAPTPPGLGSASSPAPNTRPVASTEVPATQRAAPLRVQHGCDVSGELCSNPPQQEPAEGLTTDGRVILKGASAEVLTRLPGIGAKRAEAIVKLRDRLKRFRRTTDLLRVRGIGVASLKRMLPHLVLDPPEEDGSKAPKL